jgi:glucose-6-phosphate 1-epimerase
MAAKVLKTATKAKASTIGARSAKAAMKKAAKAPTAKVVKPVKGAKPMKATKAARVPPGCVALCHPSGSKCVISIYASHVMSWSLPDVGEQLFMSSKADMTHGASIRGGVPICWPQFGTFRTAKSSPGAKHGFVRTSTLWQVEEKSATAVSMRMTPDEEMLKKWPGKWEVLYTVSLQARSLCLKMEVINKSEEAIEFTGCLHTYFQCKASDQCSVQGLKGEKYDSPIGDFFSGAKVEDRDSVKICDGKAQMQLLYGSAGDAIVLSEAGRPRLRLTKSGMSDWVIWNIGDDDVHTLKDMGEGEQRRYVCVEPGFATVPVRVAPGQTWCGVHEMSAL